MVDHTARPHPRPRAAWARWLWGWSAAGTPLVCAAILVWSPVTVMVVAVVGAVVGVLLAASVIWDPARPEAFRGRLAGLPVRALAAGTASAFVDLPMLTRAPFVVVLGVLALGVWTSPWLRARRLPGRPADPAPLPEAVEPGTAPVSPPDVSRVAAMTDGQLCAAWRHSFRTLETARSARERARVVTVRQAFLDELETRNEPGLRAWLASGARAASGPDRFLVGPPPLSPLSPWPPDHAPAGE